MSRKIIYSLLVLPLLAGAVFMSLLNADSRKGFVHEYARNLKRLFVGEWELSELRDPRKENEARFAHNGHYRRGNHGASQVFEKLDKDDSDSLDASELGKRLAARLGQTEPVSLSKFEQAMYQNWTPQQDTSLTEVVAVEPAKKLVDTELLDRNHVMVVDVKLSDSDWRTLCHQSRSHQSAVQDPLDKPYTNFRANVMVDGVSISDVAIRKKGFIGSQDTVRPSLKIKFDEYVSQAPVEGLDRLTLNNNRQDRGLVSQALTYYLFRKADLPAPRSSFAAVTVNGRYLGIYTHVESVKKPFLRKTYGSDQGRLYEGTLTDLYPPSIEWLEAKTSHSDSDRSGITRLAEVLADDSSTLSDLGKLIDIDAFVKYWAIESLINFWDGYNQNQNNYFIADNPNNGLMYFIPWGADSCFGGRPRFVHRAGEHAEVVRATSILGNRLYRFEGMPERYRETMLEVLSSVWDESELLAEIDRIEIMLRDHLDIHQASAIVASDSVRSFIRSRRETLLQELGDNWPAEIAAEPRIPRHDITLGVAEGSFALKGTSVQLNASMQLNGKTVSLDQCEIEDLSIRVLGGSDSDPIEVLLEPADLTLDVATQTHLQLTGEWVNQNRPGVEVRGLLLNPKWDAHNQLVEGKFEFEIRETRGGFMDRW